MTGPAYYDHRLAAGCAAQLLRGFFADFFQFHHIDPFVGLVCLTSGTSIFLRSQSEGQRECVFLYESLDVYHNSTNKVTFCTFQPCVISCRYLCAERWTEQLIPHQIWVLPLFSGVYGVWFGQMLVFGAGWMAIKYIHNGNGCHLM
jgi:hypothetical protein